MSHAEPHDYEPMMAPRTQNQEINPVDEDVGSHGELVQGVEIPLLSNSMQINDHYSMGNSRNKLFRRYSYNIPNKRYTGSTLFQSDQNMRPFDA